MEKDKGREWGKQEWGSNGRRVRGEGGKGRDRSPVCTPAEAPFNFSAIVATVLLMLIQVSAVYCSVDRAWRSL